MKIQYLKLKLIVYANGLCLKTIDQLSKATRKLNQMGFEELYKMKENK